MATSTLQNAKTHKDYRVGWICALPLEAAAAICMLAERHQPLPQPETDHNSYILGRIGKHDVVIGCLPSGKTGTISAARAALGMRTTFPNLRFGLLVGIGGGAPSEKHDIRLGDVVVSCPEGISGGVIQYDFGKTVDGGRFVQTGSLNRPPDVLLSAMAKLQAQHMIEDSQVPALLKVVIKRYPRRKNACTYPGMHLDNLFHYQYSHAGANPLSQNFEPYSSYPSNPMGQQNWCQACDPNRLIQRPDNRHPQLAIHYGLIASANQVMRDGVTRERLRREKGILCFEMEAAGIVDDFPCIVIRGICDYADSHKNKDWQDYAAATAAAYATELLSFIPASETSQASTVELSELSNHRIGTVTGNDKIYRDDQDGEILRSFAFTDMFGRRNNVERHHPHTCTWILQCAEYQNWLQHINGLLWIKGKPGAGKSTLMAFLYDKFRRDETMRGAIKLDFFFHARGSDLQKKPLGLLRSLIYQIFDQNERVRPSVRRLFTEKNLQSGPDLYNWQWQQPELELLLFEAIEIAAQSAEVLIFVDALDEAGETLARQVALYFHRLNDCIVSEGGSAKFCISSRHYPIVCTIEGTEISVENHNQPDIATFVSDNLRLESLIGYNADDLYIWTEVQHDLISRARGIFQWARLVVPLVEKYIADGRSPRHIYVLLQKVPQELNDVYSHILENIIGAEDRQRSLLLFQWICLAERQLSITELRFALAATKLSAHQRWVRCHETEDFINSEDRMRRLVKSLSGGLAEIIKGADGLTDVAQVIHQSVNDFLMEKGLVQLESWAYNQLKSADDAILHAHATIFQACLNYLLNEDIRGHISSINIMNIQEHDYTHMTTPIPSHRTFFKDDSWEDDDILGANVPELSFSQAVQWSENLLPSIESLRPPSSAESSLLSGIKKKPPTQMDAYNRKIVKFLSERAPLMHYAVGNVFIHASKLPNSYFVNQIQQMESMRHVIPIWREGQQVLGKLRDEDHPNMGTSLLHIAAAVNAMPLVLYLLGTGTDVDETDAWGCSAMHLAAMSGCDDVIEVLLSSGADLMLRNRSNHTPLAAALRRGHISTARLMIMRCGSLVKYQAEFERMLGVAAVTGNEVLAQLLISEAGANINSKKAIALPKAARYGHAGLVRMLIDSGADINAAGGNYGTALQMASLYGHSDIVCFLLGRGADVHANSAYGTALRAARNRGHREIVAMLMKAGASQ